jgi:hypothetical protein
MVSENQDADMFDHDRPTIQCQVAAKFDSRD